jgi:hypothetical protein
VGKKRRQDCHSDILVHVYAYNQPVLKSTSWHGLRLWQLLQPMPLDCEPLLFHPRVRYIPFAESLKPKTASSKLTG